MMGQMSPRSLDRAPNNARSPTRPIHGKNAIRGVIWAMRSLHSFGMECHAISKDWAISLATFMWLCMLFLWLYSHFRRNFRVLFLGFNCGEMYFWDKNAHHAIRKGHLIGTWSPRGAFFFFIIGDGARGHFDHSGSIRRLFETSVALETLLIKCIQFGGASKFPNI